MGRRYYGDIEGKFWFGVQSSTAPERFGAYEQNKGVIEYVVDDIDVVINEINKIETKLGKELITKMDKFFEENTSYTDEKLLEQTGATKEDLSDYADLLLGYQIKKALEDNDGQEIVFDAEI